LNENGFFELLAQLTKIGEISIEEFAFWAFSEFLTVLRKPGLTTTP
jgi:hypothetical protein